MSTHESFPIESRLVHGTDKKYAPHVGIHCCECKRWEWRKATKPGLANRIFHNSGWRIGSKRTQDICPECIALHQNRKPGQPKVEYQPDQPPPFNDAMAAQLRAALFAQPTADDMIAEEQTIAVVAEPVKETPVTEIVPDKPRTGRNMSVEDMERRAQQKAAPAPSPELRWPKVIENRSARTGYRAKMRTSEFGRFMNAQRAAVSHLLNRGIDNPQINVHYIVYGKPGDWSWMGINIKPPTRTDHVAKTPGVKVRNVYRGGRPPKPNMKPDFAAQWPDTVEFTDPKTKRRRMSRTRDFAWRSTATNAAVSYMKADGVAAPKRDVDYVLYLDGDRWGWVPRAVTAPTPATTSGVAAQDTIMHELTPTVPASDPGPVMGTQPTRAQRQQIASHLDSAYDQDKQRYYKDGSDEKLSQSLHMPRVWIKQIRVDLYGDYDRNEQAERSTAELTEAIKLAAQTKDRLLAMAAEAEKMEADLTARLRRIKGI